MSAVMPVVAPPDPYKKTDMQHAVEGYCPNCGSNESIDVTEGAALTEECLNAPVADWVASGTLHCNKCGSGFRQLYAMRFDGQSGGKYRSHLEPASTEDKLRERVELLVRDLDIYIEGVDLAAEHEDGTTDDPEWCDGYRTEFGMRVQFAESADLKRVRQRLLELKPYLEKR